MRIVVHIGLEQVGALRLQQVLDQKREQLLSKGVLYPRSPGGKNHTRLYMAVTDPAHIDPLRFNRGYILPEAQDALHAEVAAGLAREVETHRPELMILSASQLGSSLASRSELERLHALLAPLSDDIRILAHIDEQGRLLARRYAEQVFEGRAASLELELEMAGTSDWWDDALLDAHAIDPQAGQFLETQAPPFWLDYPRLVRHWEGVFGPGAVTLRPYDPALFYGSEVTEEIRAAFGIAPTIGKATPDTIPPEPAAAWLARARQLNALLLKVLSSRQKVLPRMLWRKFLTEIEIPGDPIAPGSLAEVSRAFEPANKALVKAHPALTPTSLKRDRALPAWQEVDPGNGYRASQYLLGFMWRIDKATREERKAKLDALARLENGTDPATPTPQPDTVTPTPDTGLSPTAQIVLPPLAKQNFAKLQHSSFAPHNRLGAVNEEELAAAYTPVPPRALLPGSTGNVIVGCMKNEAPYIVEWVAYHRAMGVDNFLIYTNDCTDGTTEILDRLQEMGVLQHRNNDNWKGNSPQQYALNQALKEGVIRNAEWITHIDVDEFINVRCGNGTLDDFFEHVPDATNVAMTWRLFGHNGVTRLSDDFVIDQFDTCAPKFCPKPHTVWGFKTMFRNIGAYEKISCHRPNKLDESFKSRVKWVNGSGRDMTGEAAENGWRSSKKSIGYDLLQLNHYALRSAESFLIKRQRGRALHVDRSIGINYWIRMDWSDFRDITIKRNIPRLRAEYDRLMADDTLRTWHQKGLAWHRAKAEELHAIPEFQDLYDQALKLKLTETERVAYALALDMES
ncbi:glycosyltransferase family 2 protein [Aquicoccus porphyridii]|uniref:Glycosyltransferase family 2 protein n=1 Tax=Aquicoccus porphyridii TaxID=1852029 RepID=A0A5A9ZV50_9RHOB|nr:glycosyltransferase family 2 protein [Aquicoccus porphyridii]KAA0920812.1 glycosyltransferase family 2 protein [Aquicoccus porphyridii]RAI56640.1 glycosyltransferase family 2 protein [Rhodobacteraceae bacterium AsT-22]